MGNTPPACPRGGARRGAAVAKRPGGGDWPVIARGREGDICPPRGAWAGWRGLRRARRVGPAPVSPRRSLCSSGDRRETEILQAGGRQTGDGVAECRGGRQLKIAPSLSLQECGCPRVERKGYVSPLRVRTERALAGTPA